MFYDVCFIIRSFCFKVFLALSIARLGISLLDFSITDLTFCKTWFDVSFSATGTPSIDPNTQSSAILFQIRLGLPSAHSLVLDNFSHVPEAYKQWIPVLPFS